MKLKRFFKDVSVRCALFMIAYYMTNAVFQSFMSLYFEDIGLSNTRIGIINGLVAGVSVFAMQLWGAWGDRANVRNRLLSGMCLAAGVIILVLRFNESFPYVLAVVVGFACVYTSIQPMGDSIILSSLAEQNRPFGPVRMSGGLGFAAMSIFFGYVVDAAGSRAVIYAIAVMCAAMIFAARAMPRVCGGGKRESAGGMLSLFKNRELLRLFALMVPLQITYGYFYAFFSPLLKTDLGGSGALVGWSFFLSSVSETPFLLLSDKLFEKHGAGRLMCVSALIMTVRWVIVGSTSSAVVAMFSQLLHGLGFIVITVTAAKYVQAVVPEGKKASGQLLISVFGYGVARAVGYFGGGLLSDAIGRQNVFYVCAAVCFTCLCVFAPYYLRRAPLNGKETAHE